MGLTAIFAFFKSPLGLAAIAALVAVIALAVVFHKGETAGSAEVTAKVQARTIAVQRKITDAEAAGPRTPSDVSKLLRSGSF